MTSILFLQGLRWMVGLHDHQLNGILADEMVGSISHSTLPADSCMLLMCGSIQYPAVQHVLHISKSKPDNSGMRTCRDAAFRICSSFCPHAGTGQNSPGHFTAGIPRRVSKHQRPFPDCQPIVCAVQLGVRAAQMGA